MRIVGMVQTRVAVIYWRMGPYHHARLRAAGQVLEVVGVELTSVDRVYQWAPVAGARGFTKASVFGSDDPSALPYREARRRVWETLDLVQPSVVAIPGWSQRAVIAAWEWCVSRGVPGVLMSESTPWDRRRLAPVEWVKSSVVRAAAAALVGGRAHRAYLVRLGMDPEKIFLGYDVVDNRHFSEGAARARDEATARRRALGLPDRYFLASGRFVAKKNFPLLLRAYARYRGLARSEPWELVLLGDGSLRPRLEREVGRLGIRRWVHFPGFRQYHELPAYYGLAGCFVHPSTVEQWGLVVNEAVAAGLPVLVSYRCGCAAELVREGGNGYTFDPRNADALAELMVRIASSPGLRRRMAAVSRKVSAQWSVERFAEGLAAAVTAARRAAAVGRRLPILRLVGAALRE